MDFSIYERQIILPELGIQGQIRLAKSKIFICGAGALGSPVLLYLIAAGIGEISICDFDKVELSNLNRQVLYKEKQVGLKKVLALKDFFNQQSINFIDEKLTENNALNLIADSDLVIDCTDSFSTRYNLNEACVKLGIAFVSAAIHRFSGQISVYNFLDNACYNCVYPKKPTKGLVPDCQSAGVMGFIPGLIGLFEVQEAIKVLIQPEKTLAGKILLYDGLTAKTHFLKTKRSINCFCQNFARKDYLIDKTSIKKLTHLDESVYDFSFIDLRKATDQSLPLDKLNLDILRIPLESLHKHIDKLDKSKKYLMLCNIGERAVIGALFLISAGFQDVYSLDGGIKRLKHYIFNNKS